MKSSWVVRVLVCFFFGFCFGFFSGFVVVVGFFCFRILFLFFRVFFWGCLGFVEFRVRVRVKVMAITVATTSSLRNTSQMPSLPITSSDWGVSECVCE